MNINVMYGCTPPKLAESLNKPIQQGKRLFDAFWAARSPLKRLNEDLMTAYKARGYLIGLDGRKLSIREDRKLLNTLIQGTSAVIFKRWMYENQVTMAKSHISGRGWISRLVAQTIAMHDELQYEVMVEGDAGKELAEMVAGRFAANASKVGKLYNINVPIEADYKIGKNWCECH